jgi:hypothetical protein
MHITAKSGSRSGLRRVLVLAAAAGLMLMVAPAAAQAQPAAPGSAGRVAAVQVPQASSSCGWSQTLRATHLYQGSTAVASLPACTGLYVLCYFVSTPAGNDYERDYVNWTSVTQHRYAGNVIDEYVQWYGEEASQVGYSEC